MKSTRYNMAAWRSRACVVFATTPRGGKARNRRGPENTLIYVARTRSHTAEDSCERQLTINPFTNTVFRGWPARATPGSPHGNARP